MINSEPEIRLAKSTDTEALAAFINKENPAGDPVKGSFLKWWFFGINDHDSTVCYSIDNNLVTGLACTRNFKLLYKGEPHTIAMPQKVLTASGLRKKGLFSRLYYATESLNGDKKVLIHLTITNAASTPIFLGKFGYQRGQSPDVILLPTITGITGKTLFSAADKQTVAITSGFAQPDNAIMKDQAYFHWRYLDHQDDSETILQDKTTGNFIFLKIKKFKNIPSAFLLDTTFTLSNEHYRSLCRFLLKKGILLLLVLQRKQEINQELPLHFTIKNRFNFLVKGRNEKETEELAGITFKLDFGVLDFV
jgi:hypothetical protein